MRRSLPRCALRTNSQGVSAVFRPQAILGPNLRRRVARWLSRTGRFVRGWTRGHIRCYGAQFDLRTTELDDSVLAQLFWRIYEPPERRAVLRYLIPNLPVVELGAGIGFLSSLIGANFSERQIIAVEANKRFIPVLKRHLEKNCGPHARALWGAIDYSGANEVLFPAAGNPLSNSRVSGTIPKSDTRCSSQLWDKVPAITLEKVVSEFDFSKFTLIMDIEGEELSLLESEEDDVWLKCQQIIGEFHNITRDDGPTVTPDELAQAFCRKWGFRPVHNERSVWVLQRT